MIAKMIKGKGFRGLLEYNLQSEKGYLLDTNMSGGTARDLAKEYGQIRKLRPNLNRAACHVSLSLAPGEALSDEQWKQVTADYMKHMGFANNQFVAVRHVDREHQHIHLVINRIDLEGNVTSDSNDYRKQEQLMRQLEHKYGLQQVSPSREAKMKASTRGELEYALRTGDVSVRMKLQELVTNTFHHVKSFSSFSKILALQGVEVRLNEARTGKISGISFSYEGISDPARL